MVKSLEQIELEFKAGMQSKEESKNKEKAEGKKRVLKYRFSEFTVSEIIFYTAITFMVLCLLAYAVERSQPSIGGYMLRSVQQSEENGKYPKGSLLVLKDSNTVNVPEDEKMGNVVLCIPFIGRVSETISKNLGGIILLFFLLTGLSFVLKIHAVKLSDKR